MDWVDEYSKHMILRRCIELLNIFEKGLYRPYPINLAVALVYIAYRELMSELDLPPKGITEFRRKICPDDSVFKVIVRKVRKEIRRLQLQSFS